MRALVSVLIALLATGPVRAQQSAQEEPRPPDATSKASLDRIRRALAAPSSTTFGIRSDKPLFRVEIVGKRPPFIVEITPAYFVSKITPPNGSAWHREFLGMVTPKDLGSSQITSPLDTLMAAAQTAAAFWLAKSIVKKVSSTMKASELRAIRAQIARELRELEERNKAKEKEPRKN